MPLDELEEGVILSTKMDDSGEVLATVEGVEVDGQEAEHLSDCRILQPLGLRARPRDSQAGCHFAQNGDEVEVLHCTDRDATDALGSLDPGATQIHSTGPSPQAVEVKDKKIHLGKNGQQEIVIDAEGAQPQISIGKNAQKGAVRLDDEVDCGTLQITLATSGPPPLVGINIFCTDGLGNPGFSIDLSLAGVVVPPTAPGVYVFRIRGKCVTCSSLVRVE